MDVNKQSQQAGEGSQLVQAGTIVINQGVSEERVRTVFNEMVPRALEEYTKEAYTKANERITNWKNSVLPRVNEVKGMLEAFADPAFQQVLRYRARPEKRNSRHLRGLAAETETRGQYRPDGADQRHRQRVHPCGKAGSGGCTFPAV